MKIPISFLGYGLLAAGAFAFGFSGWSVTEVPARVHRAVSLASFEEKYVPSIDAHWNGPELVMVYIGKKACGPSNARNMPQMVEDMKSVLAGRASIQGVAFRVIGTTLDGRVGAGLEHLSKFGAFDEIRVGGGAFSDAAMEYLWQDLPGEVATPQVLLFQRDRTSPKDRLAPSVYSLSKSVLVERIVGLDGITRWLDSKRASEE